MMRVAALFALLSVAAAMDFGTFYRDNAADHACFFRGDTAVGTTVAFNPLNWPSDGAWAGKAKCGTCFIVSCDSAGSTYGIPGSTSCAGRSVIAQLTNKCPECSERKGSWGSCDTCNGFHADLWTDTFAALTGCDPLSGGCNPGIIPIKIGDPVPCPATTPKIFYRDSQGFYQSFMVTGMRAAFVSASIPGFTFRVQANEINGVILNLDAVQPSQLPGSFPITIVDADGGVYTCQVSNGAAGSTFPCGGGGAIPAPVVTTQTAPADPAPANPAPADPAPANPAPADTPADTTASADGLGGSTAVTAASTTTRGCDALRPANGGSSYAAYKQCALATPGAWPPQPVAGSLAEYQQCGDDSAMPFATRCESGTVCCQTVSNYAQCIDPSDGPALAKCTTKY